MRSRALVVAKAPVVGRVKTRLGAEVGMAAAAEVAAASLLDTLAACRAAFGAGACVIALAGDLDEAVRGGEIRQALRRGWTTVAQRGATFADRLAHAHADAGAGPVVQVGMDTPQLTPGQLRAASEALADHDAVLGPAEDGGWWVLGLREPAGAAALRQVVMSTPHTHDRTRAALTAAGLDVGTTTRLRDVDTAADAGHVAAQAPHGHFGAAWRALGR